MTATLMTTHERHKITIVPLRSAEHNLLLEGESLDLGFGISVENCTNLLAASDLWLWEQSYSAPGDEGIKNWDTCLVHRYKGEYGTGERDIASDNLMGYVLAHLRLINPHRDSTDDNVHLQQETNGRYSAFHCTKAASHPNRFLCDCENLCWGITRADLNDLRGFMPWIVQFASDWETYYPLWISLHFFERGYMANQNFRILHLFRVMALEALFCTESSFGKKALTTRILKLLGTGIDLYERTTI